MIQFLTFALCSCFVFLGSRRRLHRCTGRGRRADRRYLSGDENIAAGGEGDISHPQQNKSCRRLLWFVLVCPLV